MLLIAFVSEASVGVPLSPASGSLSHSFPFVCRWWRWHASFGVCLTGGGAAVTVVLFSQLVLVKRRV